MLDMQGAEVVKLDISLCRWGGVEGGRWSFCLFFFGASLASCVKKSFLTLCIVTDVGVTDIADERVAPSGSGAAQRLQAPP